MKIHHMLFVGLAAWGGMMAYRAQKIIAPFLTISNTANSDENYDGSGIGHVGNYAYNINQDPPPVNYGGTAKGGGGIFSQIGQKPSQTQEEKDLAIFKAAADGDVETLHELTEDKYHVNARDGQRRTALMFAALNGQTDACRILLSSGANVRLKDPRGFNALDYAAGRGHVDTVRLILQASGLTDDQHALQYATLMEAAFSGDRNRLPHNTADYAPVNNISPEDQSPLIIAAGNGSADIVELLILHGADVNQINSQRQTALHWAAWNNKPATISVLLARGAKIDAADLGGNTALMFAAQNGNQDAVSLLLENGADKSMTDQKGSTAMSMAKTKGHKNISSMMQ